MPGARRRPADGQRRRPSTDCSCSARDAADAQDPGRVRGAVDDRRLDTDAARATVEDERRRRRRGRRARAAAVVGLTRPNRFADGAASPPPNAVEQLERERMVRAPAARRCRARR